MVTAYAAAHDGAISPGYPAAWEFDGLLMNGEAVVVRPIQSAYGWALTGFHVTLSPDSIHRHLLLAHPTLSLAERRRA